MRYAQLPPIGKQKAYSLTNQLRIISDTDENFMPVFRTTTVTHKVNPVLDKKESNEIKKPIEIPKPAKIIDVAEVKRCEEGEWVKGRIRNWPLSDKVKVEMLTVVELFKNNNLSQEEMFSRINEIFTNSWKS